MNKSFGSYDNMGLIGSGSYGKVYHIKKRSSQREYAIKKIPLNGMKIYDKRNHVNEIRILCSHKCPFLIEYKHAFVEGPYLCIVMQLCKHGTLEKKIKSVSLDDTTIWKYLSQVVFALDYLHKNSIIYRDLKSSNVLLDNNDNIKLIDFGISKILDVYLKYTKTCIGTPYYMSPEVLSNVHYNYKVDIWSLGVLLYEMTQRRLPFTAKNIIELTYKLSTGRIQYVHKINEEFKTIINRCLQTSPYRRITLNTLLQIPQIKNNLIHPISSPITFVKLPIPKSTIDWKNVLTHVPCRTTPEPSHIQSSVRLYKTMNKYSNSQLIALNSKLVQQIMEKNEIILKLEAQIKDKLQ